MNLRPAHYCAPLLAAISIGVLGCDSVQTTQPALSAQPALATPHSGSADVISQTYTSGSGVQTWDPIVPASADPTWPTTTCTATPLFGPNANWRNPHNAFVLGGHPWATLYFNAPWINAYNSLGSIGPSGQSWTKYQTTVSGNGSFVIKLLADNCSWIYLDGTLVGVQPANHNATNTQYGLTLNGTHTLSFIIFDGGGANGGKFLLQTTTNPPPPLNNDLDNDGVANASDNCPLTANADQADLDHDGVGDACDSDIDGDGVPNATDAYPTDPTRSVADATPPVITPTIVGDLGADGWYTSNVGVTWAVVDNESAATKSGCDDLTLTANQTEQTYTCSATSAGGTTSQSVKIKIDKSVPTVSGAVTSGTLGANDWYVSDVGVTWTPSAAGPSGQTLASSCAATSLTANTSSYTFSCSVTSGAGLTSAPATVTVKRDAMSPSISYQMSGTIGANSWYVSNVGVIWTTQAGPSGVGTCSSAPATADGTNITFSCSVTAGNGKTASVTTAPVKRDATKPVVSYSATNGGVYTVDQTVALTCSASDNLSGVQSSTCANVSGDAYNFALGTTSYSATAVDFAGNVSQQATASIKVSVTSGSLCALVQRWVANQGVANSLCVKLDKGNYAPFQNEVQAQSGKWLSADHAATLLRLVSSL